MTADGVTSLADFAKRNGTFCSRVRLGELRATVVGAGALGSEVVRLLGLLGAGSARVIDPDVVAATDLAKSIFARRSIGQNKATAIAESARLLFPDTDFEAFPCEVADIGFGDMLPVDVIFGCTDSNLSRLELAYISIQLAVPLVDGGLSAADLSAGRVSYFPGREASCYGCMLTGNKRAELLTEWDSAACSCAAANSGDGASYPSTPMLASIIASLQVEAALRYRDNPPAAAFSWEASIHPVPRIERLELTRAADCPFHDLAPARSEAPGDDCTVAGYLTPHGPSAALIPDWPLCVRARCIACGCVWAPMRRLGYVRRRGQCPDCGSREIRTEDSLTELAADSPLAALRFRQIGLPGAHSYAVRVEGR
jgi:adenylyltransferase/sulfurtransferase